jgi:hypothetical protein
MRHQRARLCWVCQYAADLDRAITLRQHHWQVLGALLTETELTSLQPAQAAPAQEESTR